MNTILEFNENEQMFNFNTGEQLENTNGYKSLMYCKSTEEAILFTDFLTCQFIGRDIHLSFEEAEKTISNLQKFVLRIIDIDYLQNINHESEI